MMLIYRRLNIKDVPASTMLAVPGLAGKTYELQAHLLRYLRLFTYLSDKAAWEYKMARDHMLGFNLAIKRPGHFATPYVVSANIDNCICTIHRLLRVFRAFTLGNHHFVISGNERKLIEGYMARIDAMRDALQHAEEHLRLPKGDKNYIPENTPIFPFLLFKSGVIKLGQHSIKAYDLRNMVQRVHTLALRLATEIKRFDNLQHNPVTNADLPSPAMKREGT